MNLLAGGAGRQPAMVFPPVMSRSGAEDTGYFSLFLTAFLISLVACLDAASSPKPMTAEKRASMTIGHMRDRTAVPQAVQAASMFVGQAVVGRLLRLRQVVGIHLRDEGEPVGQREVRKRPI